MRKKFVSVAALAVLAAAMFFMSCASDGYPPYTPEKGAGNGGFDFPSNSYSADVELDGYLTDERWQADDVVLLGTWDDSDVESGAYGAIVNDVNDYANTKRAVGRMFRGEVGFHFGFEVKDGDLAYLSLEDGDPAIYTDNILINLCTAIDGSEIPMSDDYYLLVTAFGNYCFRRGANAAGMWGAWSGVLDYEAAVHYAEDGETAVGFGVELVVPYEQLGLGKNSPLGVTFRSCDRVSASNSMIEREWWWNGGTHHFNTPNDYAIWGADNKLYSYYDYKMPEVTVRGAAVDYVDNSALAGITIGGSAGGKQLFATTDAAGEFVFEGVNPNADIVLTAAGDALLSEQTFTLDKDELRAANGGAYSCTAKLLTKKNTVSQTFGGRITTINETGGSVPAVGAKVSIGGAETFTDGDGRYSLETTFDEAVLTAEITSGSAVVRREFAIADALGGPVEYDAELPKMSVLPGTFGAAGDIETALGFTADGLYVSMRGKGSTNGYGVAFDKTDGDGTGGKVVLYHSFGTMCVTGFLSQSWDYAPPENFGVQAEKYAAGDGYNVYTFVIPYDLIGISYGESIKIAPFEYTTAGPFAYYTDPNGNELSFGSAAALAVYPVLDKNGEVAFAEADKVLSAYELAAFGKSQAEVKFEFVTGAKNGVNVTIEYTPTAGVFGFGVMFGSADKTAGITDLYAVGFGTVDHHVYGDWNWQGNYVPAAQLGIAAAESAAGDRARVTLFYPFETLCGEKYSLGIDENAVSVSLQMFEYVTDNSGNLYGIYNCINVNGAPLAFDTGAANFPVWEIRRENA